MDIDITSLIIALFSLATFAVPIGYSQIKVKRAANRARKQFLDTAANVGFQHESFEILANSATIGIGKDSKELLYVKNETDYHLLDLHHLTACNLYQSQKKVRASDGTEQVMKESGIRLSFSKTGDIKLPVFEGPERTQRGFESFTAQEWLRKINSAHHKLIKGNS